MSSKRCPGCQVVYENPHASFHNHAGRPDGLQTRCKVCMKADSYERYWRGRGGEENRQRAERSPHVNRTPAYGKPLTIKHKARRLKAKFAAAQLLVRQSKETQS